jgi:hypothetical protein
MTSRCAAGVERLELPFNELGVDPYGISKKHLATGFSMLGWMYRRYFRVQAVGVEHVPEARARRCSWATTRAATRSTARW